MNKTTISLIVPAFKTTAHLRSLASSLHYLKRYDNIEFEVILVLQGFTIRQTGEIVDWFNVHFPTYSIYHSDPIGVYEPYNSAMRDCYSDFEYVYLMDDDMEFCEETDFSALLDIFNSVPDVGLVASKGRIKDCDPLTAVDENFENYFTHHNDYTQFCMHRGTMAKCGGFLIPRKLFLQITPLPDLTNCCDEYIVHILWHLGYRCVTTKHSQLIHDYRVTSPLDDYLGSSDRVERNKKFDDNVIRFIKDMFCLDHPSIRPLRQRKILQDVKLNYPDLYDNNVLKPFK